MCVVVAIVAFTARWFLVGGRVSMAIGLAGLIGCQIALLLISRSYITRLQDRIIRLEMRLRGVGVLTPEQQRLLGTAGMGRCPGRDSLDRQRARLRVDERT